jgi:hypothetical protein
MFAVQLTSVQTGNPAAYMKAISAIECALNSYGRKYKGIKGSGLRNYDSETTDSHIALFGKNP